VTAALLAGLLAGYGIAVPVGAVGAYLVTLTARTSLPVGMAAALGVATVDGLYALVAELGGGAVARLVAPWAGALRWICAGVLIAVAARTVHGALRRYRAVPVDAVDAGPTTAVRPLRAYLTLVTMTLVNPATISYFAAVVLGGQAGVAHGAAQRGAFVLAAFIASASWQLVLAGGGTLLGRLVTGRRGQLGTALVAGAVIVVLALRGVE
jgi:arginine exporter protein ArgO